MKKRLRKKKHLREFKEFGFDLNLKTEDLKEDEYCDLFNDITLICEKYSLYFGGYANNGVVSIFVSVENYKIKITEVKDDFLAEIRQLPQIIELKASDNIDAWYGPFTE